MVKKSHGRKHQPNSVGPTRTILPSPNPATSEATGTTDWASALNTTKKSLELVEWRDANFMVDDEDFDGEYINATVGWIEEDDTWLKITSELTPSGGRAVTRVPLVNVVSRRLLLIVNSDSTSITWPERME